MLGHYSINSCQRLLGGHWSHFLLVNSCNMDEVLARLAAILE
jgi:hypothetical protein